MAKKEQALVKVKERALAVTPEQVLTFPADHTDYLLAEAVLNGFSSFTDIAEFVEAKPSVVRERLLDPIRCAWISQYVDKMVPTRLGQVLGAVYARALKTGDPNAAKMLLQQYQKWVGTEVKRNLNVDLKIDYSGFSNEELMRLIGDAARRNPTLREVISVPTAEGRGNGRPVDSAETDTEIGRSRNVADRGNQASSEESVE